MPDQFSSTEKGGSVIRVRVNDKAAKAARLRYRRAHPEKVKNSRLRYRLAHPGASSQPYRALSTKQKRAFNISSNRRRTRTAREHRRVCLVFQKGRCAICREPLALIMRGNQWGGSQLDHEHNNPLCTHSQSGGRTRCDHCIRGALCRDCNLILGHAEKRKRLDLLAKPFHQYLVDPPYRRLLRQGS